MKYFKKFKFLFFRSIAKVIQELNLSRFFNFADEKRATAPFKLLYFCGKSGTEYLNASLYSIFRYWKFLPEIIIVSDGTPTSFIEKKLIKWNKNISVISWEVCANYYRDKGNIDLYNYAANELWGKKFVAILYCAEHFPILYSDTDVLWYSSPMEEEKNAHPFIKMGQDIEECYSETMLKALNEERCLVTPPLNAGVIYATGNFSVFNKWEALCAYLNNHADNRSEQTALAILNNHFNRESYWNASEVLIKLDDEYALGPTKEKHPDILARHYVSTKKITFWRDFFYMIIKR